MPKRSNEFQKIVLLLKKHFAPSEATVTESKMLKHRITGEEKEVDICIAQMIAGHSFVLSIECTDTARNVTAEWVERMRGKHEHLETDKLVLISSAGFSDNALKEAKGLGIETYSFEELNDESAELIFKNTKSLWHKVVTLSAKKVLFLIESIGELPEENLSVSSNTLIFNEKGEIISEAKELVEFLLADPNNVGKPVTRDATENHKWFEIHIEKAEEVYNNNPIFIKYLEGNLLRKIKSIYISGELTPTINEFPLIQGKIGEDNIAWGTGKIQDKEAIIFTTENRKGERRMTISTDFDAKGKKFKK